jgi:saxitoxin biosynthesis operon SxtJ-like protein
MALASINWQPGRKALAEFSEAWLFFLGMVFTPLELLRGHYQVAALLWGLAVAGRLVGLVRPEWLRPVYLALMVVTWPIGWVVSHVALAGVYYLILTPVGLLFRLSGRDPLKRAFDRSVSTYWEPYNPNRGLERYLRQF